MLNQVVLVGRLTKDPEVITTEKGKKLSYITIAVNRAYKNADGNYETDFIHCVLWNSVAQNTTDFCKCGDVIGVKGRIETDNYKDENGNMKYVTQVVAERITFVSSKKEN